jgi:NhaA family Na+:H+ antiporter
MNQEVEEKKATTPTANGSGGQEPEGNGAGGGITGTLKAFLASEALGGILLIIATVVALIWANSPLGSAYSALWHTHISIGFGDFTLDKTLHHWINDGLMAIFFFVVGLEIKREILVGELSTMRKASLPIAAAAGGMVIPALIYVGFNFGEPSISGWGIPMATDIAFAIGIMALLGKKAPLSLKVFLTALAIVDDIGAVLVIAIFYSSDISFFYLLIGMLTFAVMMGGNASGIRSVAFYIILGIVGLWLPFLLSGVHATVAGVLGAFAIPTSTVIDRYQFRDNLQNLVGKFAGFSGESYRTLTEKQLHLLGNVKDSIKEVEPPLQKLEHGLNPWVMYGVMPLFALANAGVVFTGEAMSALFQHPISLGVFMGLLVGKVVGITSFSWLAEKLGLAELPKGSTWAQIMGAGFLAGIGFTMSLFITALAFKDSAMQDLAKMGILFASLTAGIAGFVIIKRAGPKPVANNTTSSE